MRANPLVLKRERRLKLAAFLSVLGFCLIVLLWLKSISVSFLLAVLLVYMLKPAVALLERLGLNRSFAISLLFFIITCAFVLTGYLIAPLISEQFSSFQTEVPRYGEGLKNIIFSLERTLNSRFQQVYEVKIYDAVVPYLQKYLITSIETLPQRATEILTILLLAPLFAFFLLRDGKSLSRNLLSLVPNNLFEMSLSLSHRINEQIGGFIRARLLESVIVGLVVFVGLLLFSFPYAVILAIFAAITNLIPYVGPIIGAIPALLVAAVDSSGSTMIFAVTLVYLVAQVIDMVLIIPLVVAKIVNLHPVLVILSIMAGAELGGIIGMIISIPVTSAFKLIFAAVYAQLLAQKSDF